LVFLGFSELNQLNRYIDMEGFNWLIRALQLNRLASNRLAVNDYFELVFAGV